MGQELWGRRTGRGSGEEMARTPRILIVGAGIGGLTAALALMRRGIAVTVYEQANELAEVGAGLQISANGSGVRRRSARRPGCRTARKSGCGIPDSAGNCSTSERFRWSATDFRI